MAHYAFLNDENIVTEVIVGRDETEVVDGVSDWEAHYSDVRGQRCVRTSYNSNIRKQYAGVGYFYDESADEFVSPQPFLSWSLDSSNDWQPPTPQPEGDFYWDEESLSWLPL
jgi:hypothetical protein